MPIVNVVDRRTNRFDVSCDAVYEPSWHDNCIGGSTKFDEIETKIGVFSKENVTVEQALSVDDVELCEKFGTDFLVPTTIIFLCRKYK